MKKWKVSLLIIAIVAVVIWGFSDFIFDEKENDNRKQFIVGFDAEFPPYGYLDDNGEYVGFDLDLAEEVCKRNDWKLVKRPIA